MKSALILYPHQLFEAQALPKVHTVFMVEEPGYFGVDQQNPIRLHKQKLILHRASMRRYVEEVLWPLGVNVEYIDLDVLFATGDILERAKRFDQLYFFDPIDEHISGRILQARREKPKAPAIEFLASPNFFLTDREVRDFLSQKHAHPFTDFYQWQRERFNILIGEDYKPVGGSWSLDEDKRERVPTDLKLPSFGVFGDHKYVSEAIAWVNEHFPHNPGSTDFIWPTNHAEATQWLRDFVANRLDGFAPYQDAIDGQAIWLFHSALSSSLNTGLLSPQQVVEAALRRHQDRPVPLPSLEAFIHQVLGWREFVRGQYVMQAAAMRGANIFKHQRKLTSAWYDGGIGIPPFDDMVNKVRQHAYAHHNERQMIAGNLMLLCEIDPADMQRWFSELFIDSYDWLMVPNVYGLSQLGGSASFMNQPAISASSYILQMSHYERGIWSDIWDGLYWRFIEKNRAAMLHNPRLRAMVHRLDRLDADRKRIISYRAEDFLQKFTA